mgnify:CR=1 FL=1
MVVKLARVKWVRAGIKNMGSDNMKKKVNGHIVDVPTEIFKSAFEGLALHKLASSNITDTIESESKLVKRCVESYYKFYKSLPFPLYSIENNVKYAAAAMFIQDELREPLKMWVDTALIIEVEDKMALKIIANTWAIVSIDNTKYDNTNIEEHKYDVGYPEFKWVLSRLMNNEDLASFYDRFMPSFVQACNREPMILKWELSRVLDFGYAPDRVKLSENRIKETENDCEYTIDVYCNGKRKSTENILEFRIGGSSSSVTQRSKMVKVYDFDVYKKSANIIESTGDKLIKKIEKSSMDCMASIFECIVAKGSIDDTVENVAYYGMIDNKYMVFQIYGSIYWCRSDRYSKAIEIAKNVDIYAYNNGRVYMIKQTKCESGALKDVLYSYDIDTKKLKLCKISFSA